MEAITYFIKTGLQKQIAQQQDLDRRTRVISISGGVMSGDFVFYKTNRRRRNIVINNSLELLKNKCNEHNCVLSTLLL